LQQLIFSSPETHRFFVSKTINQHFDALMYRIYLIVKKDAYTNTCTQ